MKSTGERAELDSLEYGFEGLVVYRGTPVEIVPLGEVEGGVEGCHKVLRLN